MLKITNIMEYWSITCLLTSAEGLVPCALTDSKNRYGIRCHKMMKGSRGIFNKIR